MIIGTCGYGSSGSSVVTDFLKEYNQFCVMDDFEYIINYLPGGILDLDASVNINPGRNDLSSSSYERCKYIMTKKVPNSSFVKQSGLSKKNYLKYTNELFDDLVELSWNGYNGTEFINKGWFYRRFGISFMMQRYIPFFEKRTKKAWVDKYPYHKIVMCKSGQEFLDAVKKFNRNIIKDISNNFEGTIVLDQPFLGDNPASCMKFFDSPKAIVVDRNPVDTYIFLKTKLKNRGAFMPSKSVIDFVSYYKNIRKLREKNNSKDVLYISFEDMVYKYEETTKKLISFLGIGENPNPKTIFIPENSMANTQLKDRFPQFKEDIEYIEKELKEYLYDFSSCPKPDLNKEMFFGRSTVNNKGNEKTK